MILPCFFLLNSRSLLPKLDELTELLSFKPIDIIAITESWLHEHIDSSLLSINDYNLFRKDRAIGRGGGICAYIKKDIPCIRRLDLESENLECLWLSIRPKRLPRPLSGIVICVVYHPPGLTISEHNDLNEYLINTIDLLRNNHPDLGLVIMGDFNDLEIRSLTTRQNLKQVVANLLENQQYSILFLQTCIIYMTALISLLH